jgi:hypothetical protein
MSMTTTATTSQSAPYVTTYSEEQWLDVLYLAVRNGSDRLAMLQKLSNVKLMRPREWDRSAIRYSFADSFSRLFLRGLSLHTHADQCFGCLNRDRWLYWHHVIQVQHGGSNSPRNLVRLCHRCHRTVHPWLEEPTTTENRSGWTSMADLVSRAKKKLSAVFRNGFQQSKAPDDDQPF